MEAHNLTIYTSCCDCALDCGRRDSFTSLEATRLRLQFICPVSRTIVPGWETKAPTPPTTNKGPWGAKGNWGIRRHGP